MTCFKRGERLFIPVVQGLCVPKSAGRLRVYKSVERLKESMPKEYGKYEVVEYAEMKHGEWIYEPSSDTLGGTDATYDWMCSVCKDTSVDDTKFCPNCGAKMYGGKEE